MYVCEGFCSKTTNTDFRLCFCFCFLLFPSSVFVIENTTVGNQYRARLRLTPPPPPPTLPHSDNQLPQNTGGEVYQRLTPPIVEITPKACEPSVPFLCEVILRPSERARGSSNKAIGTTGATSAAASAASAAGDQSAKSVTYFLRGWAEAPANRGGDRDRVSLRQQVAPRSARVAGVGGAGGGRRVSMPPPPAVFSALGHVARGGKRLEKLVTQEVTYVGEQLRIGRTKGGDVYVYERCDWPEEM